MEHIKEAVVWLKRQLGQRTGLVGVLNRRGGNCRQVDGQQKG